MKKFIVLITALLIVASANAQKWEHVYGKPNYKEWADDVIEHYDHGFYILGSNEDMEWDFKTDVNGDSLYNKYVFHDLYIHREHAVVYDEAGNLYICGTIFLDQNWPIIMKYNSCGEKVWCRVFINSSFDDGSGWDIIITENGDLAVLVYQNSDSQIDQILLYCLNTDGELLWIKPYVSKTDYPNIGVAIGFNLYHYNSGYFIDGYIYWPYPTNPNHVYLRPLFVKIDSLFNEEWVLPFGVSDSIVGEAYGTIPLNDSVYFGIGVRVSSATYNQNSLLMFFNDDGEEIGYNQISNADFGENVDFNTMWNINPINDTLFLTKFYTGENDTVFHGETVIDTSGTIHIKNNRGPGNGIADIINTSDNNYVEVTELDESKGDKDIWLYKFDKNLENVNTYVYDSLCPGGIQSGTIDITDCFVWTDVKDAPTPEVYYAGLKVIPIKAYPNPVKDGTISLEFENTEYHHNMELKCFDIYGKEVHKEKVYRFQGESVVDVSGWNNGMYVAVVYINKTPSSFIKFIVNH